MAQPFMVINAGDVTARFTSAVDRKTVWGLPEWCHPKQRVSRQAVALVTLPQ